MLAELKIINFAIIDHMVLNFSPGLNVLTGETGAGKSIILDAVSLLLGARADFDSIRASEDFALVEGVFSLPSSPDARRIRAILQREALEGDDESMLIMTRELKTNGRSISRVNGHSVSLAIMVEIAEGLVDIHGQSEHLTLLKPATHVDLLDRFGGHFTQRQAFSDLVAELTAIRSELNELLTNSEQKKMRIEMLRYQVDEIDKANLKPGEEEDLRSEAKLLANAETLAEAATEAYAALYESSAGGPSASDLIAEASRAIDRLAQIDPELASLSDTAREISIQIEDLIRDLARYQQAIDFDPNRLSTVELRLDLISQLRRRYNCDSIEALIQQRDQAFDALTAIESSDDRIATLQDEEADLLIRIGEAGALLSAARSKTAEKLAKGIEKELADLKMKEARFKVALDYMEDPRGATVGDIRVAFDRKGIDQVEFLISPNVGEPLKPIARIASGGETARIMLALKNVLSQADETPTLIFDEIDSGIGGRIGAIVGEKLWRLSGSHQVMVVTHLPQLAAFAERHLKVQKDLRKGRTLTTVTELLHEQRVEELSAMLGAEAESSRQTAGELLDYVDRVKAAASDS